MPTKHITKHAIDSATPDTKDSYLWDDDLAGFGVKITPKGRKVYLIQYRIGGRKGRTRRVTIGVHGTLTPDEARKQAKELLGQVAAGMDPAERINASKNELTVDTLFERFLREHAGPKLKTSTSSEYNRIFRQHIRPKLGPKGIRTVSRSIVSALHLSMKDTPYQANRTLGLLSTFFKWCELHAQRDRGTNPCRHIKKFKEKQSDRFLSGEELARLGEALSVAQADGSQNPYAIAALRLLVLSGARLSEILSLEWRHIDFENHCLRLPDSKNGQKTIYLNGPALDVMAGIPRQEGNPYVICGKKTGSHLVNIHHAWGELRKAAGLEDVRIHDLRHSYASVAAAGGQSLTIIGKLLGHTQSQTTLRYAHLADDPVRSANAQVGLEIANALSGNARNDKQKRGIV